MGTDPFPNAPANTVAPIATNRSVSNVLLIELIEKVSVVQSLAITTWKASRYVTQHPRLDPSLVCLHKGCRILADGRLDLTGNGCPLFTFLLVHLCACDVPIATCSAIHFKVVGCSSRNMRQWPPSVYPFCSRFATVGPGSLAALGHSPACRWSLWKVPPAGRLDSGRGKGSGYSTRRFKPCGRLKCGAITDNCKKWAPTRFGRQSVTLVRAGDG